MSRKTPSIPFVNLHGHSTFSINDGFGFPQEHMDFAYNNGCDALALTDHGHANGMSYQLLHAKKMKAEGKDFKPIFSLMNSWILFPYACRQFYLVLAN